MASRSSLAREHGNGQDPLEQPALEDGRPESDQNLQLIGQELVVASEAHEFLVSANLGKGKGHGGKNEVASNSTELIPATPVPREGRRTPEVEGMVEGGASLGGQNSQVELYHTGGSMYQGSQSVPNGPPIAYGPTPVQPLFDNEQLERFATLQQQAGWIYEGQRPRDWIPVVPRPAGLMEEERRVGVSHPNESRSRSLAEIPGLRQWLESEVARKTSENEVLKKSVEENRKQKAELMKENERLRKDNFDLREEMLRKRLVFEEASEREKEEACFETPEEKILGEEVEKERLRSEDEKKEERRSEETRPAGSIDSSAFQVMAKLMEGMQEMQKAFFSRESSGSSRDKSEDQLRGGPMELPALPEWSAQSGPIDFSDWMVLIEPSMSDLSNSSGEWWSLLVKESQDWYSQHLKLQPLDRVDHNPTPSSTLAQWKWARLERRASTLLLMALQPSLREELVASKRLTALRIVCHLMMLYQPGGLGEKELILRQLESPPEAGNLAEAVQGLRRWSRWRNRASDLGVQEPDPFLLLKGLNKITRRTLEQHRDLSFRISLARSTLQVDSTPTSRSVTSFALHLLAEFEQIVHVEAGGQRRGGADKQKTMRLKKIEDAEKDKSMEGDKKTLPKCRFFLTKEGCRRGKSCKFDHDQRDELRRCYDCGCPDHLSPSCPRKKNEGSPTKPKAAKAEVEEERAPGPEDKEPGGVSAKGDQSAAMKELLEEANRMLKSLTASSEATSTTTATTQKDEVAEKLQRRTESMRMKVLRLSRMGHSVESGLIDSGATHPLRPRKEGEKLERMREVVVTLATGGQTKLRMNQEGTMITTNPQTEPILPMGALTKDIKCSLKWNKEGLVVKHPIRGVLPVSYEDGCPILPRDLTLQLIEEIENQKVSGSAKEIRYEEREDWMKELVESHPVLRDLPGHIKGSLVEEVGEWSDIPANRRTRKRMQKKGVVVHLYAGPDSGVTLRKAMQQNGVDVSTLLEIDLERSESHDMLAEKGPYRGLLRVALEGKLEAMIGGPNCRTRSLLRHRPVPGQPDAPRPVRSWEEGQEYGLKNMTEEERVKVQQDDILLWRMIFLFIVGSYVKQAMDDKSKVGFLLEQPASPRDYMPEVVSLWDQRDWKEVSKEFNLEELTVNQGDYGGAAVKPTTLANNMSIQPSTPRRVKKVGKEITSSKDLSRWAPGIMDMVSKALKQEILKEKVVMKAMSWEDHIAFNHIPFRRDCVVCQQAQQRQAPHRRIKHPLCGVLSLDTTGPFPEADDLEGKAKFVLVGALTWMVPENSKKLMEDIGEALPVPEDAPILDEEIEEQGEVVGEIEDGNDEHQEEENKEERGKESSEADALGNVEDATRDVGEEEQNPQKESEEQEGFEVRVYRMALPMSSKNSEEVMATASEMLIRLRTDGFHVQRIHVDQGREFMGRFRSWVRSKDIALTTTPGDSPQSNGRAETAVQAIKAYVRRTLLHAKVGSQFWPLAVRYVNEVMRNQRINNPIVFPSFLDKVYARKRRWVQNTWEPVVETVTYICPSWEHHGHWIQRPECRPTVIRSVMRKGKEPVSEDIWLALEREERDMHEVRRRYRGKTAIRRIKIEEEDETDQDLLTMEMRTRAEKILEEEMFRLVQGDPEMAVVELPVINKLKTLLMKQTEEDEILQTKIISPAEVVKQWEKWLPASKEEVNSLLCEKQALREVTWEEYEIIKKEAEAKGKRVELIPSKLVFTKKPAPPPQRFKYKVRWVVCGNYEMKREGEETFSGGADSAALRIAVWAASRNQWEACCIDVKTAFLNAAMANEDEEAVVLIKPPFLFVDKGMMKRNSCFQPLRAVYGFRRSPRLWGIHRDKELEAMEFQVPRMEKTLVMINLDAEPHLWKLVEKGSNPTSIDELYGLLMTYVDDILVVGSLDVVESVISKLRQTWSTSNPEWVSEKPVRFLGMEVGKTFEEDKERYVWWLNQESYIRDLIGRNEKVKPRQVPITKDLVETTPEEKVTPEEVKEAQKAVGELLWLVTRSRPDLAYSVSKMGSMVTKAPRAVLKIYQQVVGFLMNTIEEGLRFETTEDEPVTIQAYSDASFAPHDDRSHGCFLIKINSSPVLWRSGRQGVMTISTAESELMELIDAISAGESISSVLGEIASPITKYGWCDNQATISIVVNESGSWRTRHLRVRAVFLRQLVASGEWMVQHLIGNDMIADLGTKVLTAIRLRHLCQLLGMGKPKEKEQQVEISQAGALGNVEDATRDTCKGDSALNGDNRGEAEAIVRLITLAAVLHCGKAQSQGEKEEGESLLWTMIFFYTMVVVMATMIAQWILRRLVWKSEERGPEQARIFEKDERGPEQARIFEKEERGPEQARTFHDQVHRGEQQRKQEREEMVRPSFLPSVSVDVEVNINESSHQQHLRHREVHHRQEGQQETQGVQEVQGKKEERTIKIEVPPRKEEEERTNDMTLDNQPGSSMDFAHQQRTGPGFKVFTTKFGEVVHLSTLCGYVARAETGPTKEARWCHECCRLSQESGRGPIKGEKVKLEARDVFHTNVLCPRYTYGCQFSVCKHCVKKF